MTDSGLTAYRARKIAGVVFKALGDTYPSTRVRVVSAEVLQLGRFPQSMSDVLGLAENWVAPFTKSSEDKDVFMTVYEDIATCVCLRRLRRVLGALSEENEEP